MKTYLSVNDVHFAYNNTEVLCGANLTVHEQDFIALVGSNGSGKSTLLKILLGLLKPQVGNVECAINPIGYVPQGGLIHASSFPASVLEVVMMRLEGGSFFSTFNGHRKSKALEALKQVGMDTMSDRLISSLSGGQLQRVLIARELVVSPKLLVLDEPTSGLDEASIYDLLEILKKLNHDESMTIIVVNHDIEEIKPYVNRMVRMSNMKCNEVTL